MTDAPERLLTPKEVAGRLGIGETTTKDWLRHGQLPVVRVGRKRLLRMSEADLNEYIRQHRQPAKDQPPAELAAEDAEDLADAAAAIAEVEREGTVSLEAFKAELGLDKPATSIAYEEAATRINTTPELEAFKDVILADWPEGDSHFTWAATCPLAELISWAQAVARDVEGEGAP